MGKIADQILKLSTLTPEFAGFVCLVFFGTAVFCVWKKGSRGPGPTRHRGTTAAKRNVFFISLEYFSGHKTTHHWIPPEWEES